MTAKEANKKTVKTIKSLITPQYEKVMKDIEMAILKGNFYTNIDIYLYNEVVKQLKTEGYKISTKWRHFSEYKISWKSAKN